MTITLQAVNELIASLESAGELSIKERKYLELAREFKQLAAENVGLKSAAEFATAPDMWIEQADGMLDYRYCDWYVDVLKAAMETSATDRIVAGIKADGVEMFALMFAEEAIKDNNITTGWKARASRAASEYAELLREGAK